MTAPLQIIVGIDPGSRYTGYGVIAFQGDTCRRLVSGRIECFRAELMRDKVLMIHSELSSVLKRFPPTACALEQGFHSVNARSSLILGQIRGAIMLSCALSEQAIYEYTPTQIKKSISGVGRADKEQLSFMVRLLLNEGQATFTPDESDALATALCHSREYRLRQTLSVKRPKR